MKKASWSEDDDKKLFTLYKSYGSKWAIIARNFLGRSDNDVKNRFYSTLRRVATKKVRDDPHSTGKAISQVKDGLLQYLDEAAENGHNCRSKRGRRKRVVKDAESPVRALNVAQNLELHNAPPESVVVQQSEQDDGHQILATSHIPTQSNYPQLVLSYPLTTDAKEDHKARPKDETRRHPSQDNGDQLSKHAKFEPIEDPKEHQSIGLRLNQREKSNGKSDKEAKEELKEERDNSFREDGREKDNRQDFGDRRTGRGLESSTNSGGYGIPLVSMFPMCPMVPMVPMVPMLSMMLWNQQVPYSVRPFQPSQSGSGSPPLFGGNTSLPLGWDNRTNSLRQQHTIQSGPWPILGSLRAPALWPPRGSNAS